MSHHKWNTEHQAWYRKHSVNVVPLLLVGSAWLRVRDPFFVASLWQK